MALTIKQKFITEELKDENGNTLGVLKFNPNDSRIIAKLTKIINDSQKAIEKLKSMEEVPDISDIKLDTLENIDSSLEIINKNVKMLNYETNLIESIFKDLNEVFGKEVIDIFTGGTQDIEAITPLLDFVMPYVNSSRQNKVSKYIVNNPGIMQ